MDATSLASQNDLPDRNDSENLEDEVAMFNLDDDDDFARANPPQATLNDLANMQRIIECIQGASFDDERKQWSSDEFNSFLYPPNEQFCADDPQLRLSLKVYESLSAHSSEATYEAVCRSIKECYPDSTMLSFDQVRSRLKSISGILPLRHDMCPNSCMAFTGPFSALDKCQFCGEGHFRKSRGCDKVIPRRQFVTLPMGHSFKLSGVTQELLPIFETVCDVLVRPLLKEKLIKGSKTTTISAADQNILISSNLVKFLMMT